jgi:hypothetical protein
MVCDFRFPSDFPVRIVECRANIGILHRDTDSWDWKWQKAVSGPPVRYDGDPLPPGEYRWQIFCKSAKGNDVHLFIPYLRATVITIL